MTKKKLDGTLVSLDGYKPEDIENAYLALFQSALKHITIQVNPETFEKIDKAKGIFTHVFIPRHEVAMKIEQNSSVPKGYLVGNFPDRNRTELTEKVFDGINNPLGQANK